MAISPLGNVVVVNQMTPAASAIPNAHHNRVDIQNIAAQAAANEQKKEIEQIRPTEQSHEIDPDREHQRQEADENTPSNEQEKQEQNPQQEQKSGIYKLDIKV